MAIALQRVRLDSAHGDDEARLVLRDGRLIAVLSCLGDLHGELLGCWFVEASFGEHPLTIGQVFANLTEFETLLSD